MSWLANRRRGVGRSLPYDAEVEYLESVSGENQYIDTGIKASGNLVARIKVFDYFEDGVLNRGQWLFGGRNAYNQKSFGFFIDRATYTVNFAYGNNTLFYNSYQSYQNQDEIYIDGNGNISIGEITHSYSMTNFVGGYNIYLFCLNNGGSIIGGPNKIGSVYISNGVDTIDFIPVRKNGVGYYYDKVSGRLFGDVRGIGFRYGTDK